MRNSEVLSLDKLFLLLQTILNQDVGLGHGNLFHLLLIELCEPNEQEGLHELL